MWHMPYTSPTLNTEGNNMNTYTPSTTINEANLWPCKNLSTLVSRAKALGYAATVDWGEGDELRVTSKNVRKAVHETDVSWVRFYTPDSEYSGSILVIPENDKDWLSDYTVQPWLDSLISEFDFG